MTELQAAIAAAQEAGALLRDAFGQSHTVTLKQSAIDLVTEMDQAANTLIIERLQTAYPGYGFYTEESPAIRGTDDAHWLIDPLDGTTNYVHGYPFFAVSIALERAGQLAVGVVYNPISDELFAAQRGHGATLNGRPIRVSEASTLRDNLLAFGFPYNAWESKNDNNTAAIRCRQCWAARLSFRSSLFDLSNSVYQRLPHTQGILLHRADCTTSLRYPRTASASKALTVPGG